MRSTDDMIKLVLDTVQLLLYRSMDPIQLKTHRISNQDIPFVADSYDNYTKGTLKGPNFYKDLKILFEKEKEFINDETIEFI